jgi:hypothetical protein
MSEKPDWAVAMRVLPDGRALHVVRLLSGTARLTISLSEHALGWEDGW